MIYIASPYTHPRAEIREERAQDVMRFCAHVVQRGTMKVIYSPIASWHEIAKIYTLPKDIEFWRRLDYGMLRLASELWVLRLDGWDESKGVEEEIELATLLGLTIRHFEENGQEVV